MEILVIFSVVLLYQTVFVFLFGDVGCSCVVNSHGDTDRFRFSQGYSITDCITDCGLASHCMALNYIQPINVCELFSSDENISLISGNCIYLKRSDIQDTFKQIPCRGCHHGESCDSNSKICKRKECLKTTKLANGRVFGNLRAIGNVVRFQCNRGFQEKNGITTATCLASGNWSETPECTRVCKEPVIQNAFITNGGILEGDTRNVTCLNGTTTNLNKTVSSIKCAEDGSWIPVDITCSKFNSVVFRAMQGNGYRVAEAWKHETGTTSDITCRNPMNSNCAAHYRDPRIDDWNSLNVQKVRYSIYKDGKEVVWVLFDGTGSNMTDWFQASRIIDSSYSDLSPTSEFNVFSIDPPIPSRRFYVSVLYNGCHGDIFYFVTIDETHVCWYDWHQSYPQILYSSLGTKARAIEENIGFADSAIITLCD